MPDTQDMGIWGDAFVEWCVPFMELSGVNHVQIEAPIIALHRSEGGAVKANMNEVRKLLSIVSFAQYAAVLHGATHGLTPRGTASKHFGGKGNGPRRELKAACFVAAQHKGWKVTSQDVADALAVLDQYTWAHKVSVPWDNRPLPGPLFTAAAHGTRIDRDNKRAASALTNSALSFDRQTFRGEGK